MEHIANQFMMGETEIIICDNQCVSAEEAQIILEELAQKIKFCEAEKKDQPKLELSL